MRARWKKNAQRDKWERGRERQREKNEAERKMWRERERANKGKETRREGSGRFTERKKRVGSERKSEQNSGDFYLLLLLYEKLDTTCKQHNRARNLRRREPT